MYSTAQPWQNGSTRKKLRSSAFAGRISDDGQAKERLPLANPQPATLADRSAGLPTWPLCFSRQPRQR
jgi:hypothetical protein